MTAIERYLKKVISFENNYLDRADGRIFYPNNATQTHSSFVKL